MDFIIKTAFPISRGTQLNSSAAERSWKDVAFLWPTVFRLDTCFYSWGVLPRPHRSPTPLWCLLNAVFLGRMICKKKKDTKNIRIQNDDALRVFFFGINWPCYISKTFFNHVFIHFSYNKHQTDFCFTFQIENFLSIL